MLNSDLEISQEKLVPHLGKPETLFEKPGIHFWIPAMTDSWRFWALVRLLIGPSFDISPKKIEKIT